ncbi:MAG: CoA transferase, partial [Acidimicrobiales bacterium]
VSLLDSMLQLMGPLAAAWIDHGYLQPRMGSQLPYSVPRGSYKTADGMWLALSASADSVALRLMKLLELDDERFASFAGRVEHRDVVDRALCDWISARDAQEVLETLEANEIAVAPILDTAGLVTDPHAIERECFIEVDGMPMQNLVARLSDTPGEVRWAGREHDADGDDVRVRGWS